VTITLVTGATGFIGSHVTRQLLERGETVRVLVRTPAKLAAVGLADHPELQVATGDLLVPETIERAMAGVDRVHHIAGFVSTARADRDRLHQLNYDTTVNLYDAAQRAGVERIVYLASIFALGAPDAGAPTPVDETVRFNLGDTNVDYFRAKRRAELHTHRRIADGLPIVLAYPCFCLGPGDVYLSSSQLVKAFLDRKLPAYVAGGQNVMDVRDAAAGLRRAMDKGAIGEKYLLGGHNLSTRDVLARLSAITGLSAPRIRVPATAGRLMGRLVERAMKNPPFDERAMQILGGYWYYDDSKARRELGHTSRPIDETLAAAVDWCCDSGLCRRPPRMVPRRPSVHGQSAQL
jgi:dihydroflavonol-4-reductase